MLKSYLIKNARMVNEGEVFEGDLLVENGRIAKIDDSIGPKNGNVTIIDANGKFLLPGIIDDQVHFMMQRFIEPGLAAVETMLNQRTQTAFAHGDAPGLIDICIMPQLYNADRWGVEVSAHTNITRIADNCAAHPAFQTAHPDAVKPSA